MHSAHTVAEADAEGLQFAKIDVTLARQCQNYQVLLCLLLHKFKHGKEIFLPELQLMDGLHGCEHIVLQLIDKFRLHAGRFAG